MSPAAPASVVEALARKQAHRLDSMGRLAVGMAHEANTLIQVVSDSLHFAREAGTDADTPEVVDRALESLDRIAILVRSMREFARADQQDPAPMDLNHAIRSTLALARNEYKYVADLAIDLEEIPTVTCLRGDVNHAILDLVVDAADAVAAAIGDAGLKGLITVRSRQDGDDVVVSFETTPGAGATRVLRLPIDGPESAGVSR